jgi:hypothetical protein
MTQDLTAKGLELLRTVVPTIRTVAVLFNPANPGNRLIMEDVRNKAATLGLTVQPIEFKGPDTLDRTIEAATGNDAFLMVGDAALIDLRDPIAALTLRHRLPTAQLYPRVHRCRRAYWLWPIASCLLQTRRDLREEGARWREAVRPSG